MNNLTAPRESTILGPDGKPIIKQVPVVPNRDCPMDMVFFVPARKRDETVEAWAHRCGLIKNVEHAQ